MAVALFSGRAAAPVVSSPESVTPRLFCQRRTLKTYVEFGEVQAKKSGVAKFIVENTTTSKCTLEIAKIPSDVQITAGFPASETLELAPSQTETLTVQWTPSSDSGLADSLYFMMNGSWRLGVTLHGKVVVREV